MSKFTDKVTKFGPRMMRDLNLTKVQVAGIFGNLGGETGGFALLQEQKPLVAGSRGGYGWMQWTGPRRRKYEAWAKAEGLNVADDETNYRYLVQETLTEEKASLVALRKTTTVRAATETFMLRNLRPGIPHLEGRYRWGDKAMAALSEVKEEKKPSVPTPVKDAIKVGAPGLTFAVLFQEHIIPIAIVSGIILGTIFLYRYFQKKDKENV